MRQRCGLLVSLLLVLLAAAPPALAKHKPEHKWLVFTNVTVVNVRDGTLLPGLTVVIRDQRINAIAKRAVIELDRTVQVVNATGKYLVAGRWNMATDALEGLGNMAVGQDADLLLLDTYPLPDLRDTQRVRSAVVKGQLLDRPALEKLLEEAKASQKTPE